MSASLPALVTWVVLALLVGVLVGFRLGRSTAPLRRRDRWAAPAPAADRPAADDGAADAPRTGTRPTLELDDLPAFLEHPPGSPPPGTPVAATTTPTTVVAGAGATASSATVSGAMAAGGPTGSGRHAAGELSARRTVLAMVVAAAVLVAVAVLIALVAGGIGDRPVSGAPAGPSAGPGTPGTAPSDAPPAGTPGGAAEEAVEVPAGALAARSVPLGEDGMAVRAIFGSVLLAERAVGVTVTSPALSVTTDGDRTLAHLRLPTSNCLTRRPPADPASAGCARGATEFAELTGPALRMSRDGDRLELTGRFPTYTRPPGRPAAYTGRSYRVSASLEADGPAREGRAPAAGVLRLGSARSVTTGGPDLNVVQLRG